jgi:hypothetical protein
MLGIDSQVLGPMAEEGIGFNHLIQACTRAHVDRISVLPFSA